MGKIRRRRKRKGGSCLVWILVPIFIILILGGMAAIFLAHRYQPTKNQADLKEYYQMEEEGKLPCVVNKELIPGAGAILNGQPYIRYQDVKELLNERIYIDRSKNVLLYALPESMIEVAQDVNSFQKESETVENDGSIWTRIQEEPYISLVFVKQFTDMDYQVFENPSRITVQSQWRDVKVSQTKKQTEIRVLGGLKSDVLKTMEKGEEFFVIDEEVDDWLHGYTKDGFIGYIKESHCKKVYEKQFDRDFQEIEYLSIKKDGKISLVWDNVTNTVANEGVKERLAPTKGVTTISPTWFTVASTSGTISSISSESYIETIHQMGLEVWPTIRDFDSEGGINSSEETATLLADYDARAHVIEKLLEEAKREHYDGINVDFEKVTEDSGDDFAEFIRELSIACRKAKIVLSVDNYVPQSYNKHYHRKEQGVFADYVVIMGYDEHTYGSEEPGSVASLPFVKQGIEGTLKEVPSEKVINAVPFYTRLWKIEGGNFTFESMSMEKAQKAIESAGVSPQWDCETKQNYGEWQQNGATYKIWLEDEKSLEEKLNLMKNYSLAGVAAWRLGQETGDVWSVMESYMK